ncbi:MAG TPA: (2Fe-2S)-binding protein [Candidatus Binatia bacterium]|nr:(2Fe-2S)-binding protein [Candidatus Binatia bacterium]
MVSSDHQNLKAGHPAIDEQEQKARQQAVIDNLKPACICNKIRRGTVAKAIQAGAKTFEQVSKRTGVGTGPCGGRRCGSLVRGMLGEPVITCKDCGWPVLVGAVCPRCEYAKQES